MFPGRLAVVRVAKNRVPPRRLQPRSRCRKWFHLSVTFRGTKEAPCSILTSFLNVLFSGSRWSLPAEQWTAVYFSWQLVDSLDRKSMFSVGPTVGLPSPSSTSLLTCQRFLYFFSLPLLALRTHTSSIWPLPEMACVFCCTTPSQPAVLLRVFQKVKGHVTSQRCDNNLKVPGRGRLSVVWSGTSEVLPLFPKNATKTLNASKGKHVRGFFCSMYCVPDNMAALLPVL